MGSKAVELIFPARGGFQGILRAAIVLSQAGNPFAFALTAASVYGPYFFGPKVPGGEVRQPSKSPYPPRRSLYGEGRLAGYYILFEARGGDSWDIQVVHDGELEEVTGYYMFDEAVTLDVDGYVESPDGRKYLDQHARFYVSMGADPGGAAFADFVSALSADDVWTTDHRADGSACIGLHCIQASEKKQQERFPNGLPLFSIRAKGLKEILDLRDNVERWTDNGPLCLADYLTSSAHGMARSFAKRIAPTIEYWKAAADDCDTTVPLAAGGSEKRYRTGGAFDHTTDPAEVVGAILSSFDGWMAPRGDGALILRPGRYEPPTLTIVDKYVIGYTLQHFVKDEDAVNELTVTFSDPTSNFNEGDAGAWRDDADIDERGIVRSQPFALPWVQSPSQARRLAKRQMSRANAPLRGTFKLNLWGLKLLGERYVGIEVEDNSALLGIVGEIQRVDIDIAGLAVTVQWVQADPNIDDWDPETEEVAQSEGGTLPPSDLAAPDITDVEVIFEGGLARLRITATGPDRPDLTWFSQWRIQGQDIWIPAEATDIDPGDDIILEAAPVATDNLLEVQVAYSTGGGSRSDWGPATPFEVDTTLDGVAPDAATSLSFTPGTAAGSANYSFRAPLSTNFDHAKILRSLDSNVANAVQVGADIVGSPGAVFTGTVTAGVGNYFWVQTFNAAGTGNTPTAYASNPVSIDYYGPGTNLLPNPNDFSAWTVNHSGGTSADPVVTANNVVAPDGTTTADTIVFTRGTGTFSRIEQNPSGVTNGVSYDFDVWLKAPSAGLSVSQRLDSNNGAALSLTTSWQRYTLTATAGGTSMETQMLLFSSISGSPAGPITVHAAFAKLHAH